MRRWWIVFLLPAVVFASTAWSGPLEVNGRVEVRGEHRILHLWGTHYEMGFANAYLMADEIMHLINNYVGTMIPPALYPLARPVFEPLLTVPEPYLSEFRGLLDGLRASGVDTYIRDFRKHPDLFDVIIINAMADLGGMFNFGCSSTLAWGPATMADPFVRGGMLLCRDMDWTDPNAVLQNESILITYEPSDPNLQPWVSVGFPGYIGCLSGMNESGLAIVQHVGNDAHLPTYWAEPGVPINITLRKAIETRDYDGDGKVGIGDVYNCVRDHPRVASVEIPVAVPCDPARPGDCAAVIEARFNDLDLRTSAHNNPYLGEYVLAATNHHRKLSIPVPCRRYSIIERMLLENPQVDTDLIWAIETAARQSTTLHTMTFRPNTRDFILALARDGEVAPFRPQQYYRWSDLFPNHRHLVPKGSLMTDRRVYYPGNEIILRASLKNRGYDREVTLYIAREEEGVFTFWPHWTETLTGTTFTVPRGLDWEGTISRISLSANATAHPITFWMVLVDPTTGEIVGSPAQVGARVQD
jgi:hypothetical protein